jgi:hypothetical protein
MARPDVLFINRVRARAQSELPGPAHEFQRASLAADFIKIPRDIAHQSMFHRGVGSRLVEA